MGQQEQQVVAEQQQAGGALRRIMLVVAVAALMALVMAASAMPAFAAGQGKGVPKGGQGTEDVSQNPGEHVNDSLGDNKNNVCFNKGNCAPLSVLNGAGTGNN